MTTSVRWIIMFGCTAFMACAEKPCTDAQLQEATATAINAQVKAPSPLLYEWADLTRSAEGGIKLMGAVGIDGPYGVVYHPLVARLQCKDGSAILGRITVDGSFDKFYDTAVE